MHSYLTGEIEREKGQSDYDFKVLYEDQGLFERTASEGM